MKKRIHDSLLQTLLILTFCTVANAQTWTITSSLKEFQMWKVWGTSSTNLFASGNGGYLAKWNGSAWTDISTNTITGQRLALWGTSANNMYSTGSTTGQQAASYDGSAWTIITNANSAYGSGAIRSVWGTSSSNIYMGGAAQTTPSASARILRWNGTAWANQPTGTNTTFSSLTFWGTDANNVWVGGSATISGSLQGIIYKWNPTNSTWEAQTGAGMKTIRAMWGTSVNNIWAVGGDTNTEGKIYRYNGTSWTDVTPSAGIPLINGIWGQDAYNVWAVGFNGTILKWNGTSWNSQTSGTTASLTSVFVASGSSDIWVTAEATTNNILYSNQPLVPLPLNLLSFTASIQENHIALKWITVAEVNTDRFDIEVASENMEFETVASVPTTGKEVSKSNEYRFDFTNAERGRTYYFRLKMLDKDGSSAQSKMISGRIGAEPATFVFPNPTSDYLELKSSEIASITKIVIVDSKGNIVVSKAKDFKEKIDVSRLSSGSYFMRISKKDGSQVSRQFLVQR